MSTRPALEELKYYRGYWGSEALAAGHFAKHRGDTGYGTELKYLRRARELTTSRAGGGILSKEVGGNVLFFDQATGQFASRAKGAQIRTLFVPSRGQAYYDAQ